MLRTGQSLLVSVLGRVGGRMPPRPLSFFVFFFFSSWSLMRMEDRMATQPLAFLGRTIPSPRRAFWDWVCVGLKYLWSWDLLGAGHAACRVLAVSFTFDLGRGASGPFVYPKYFFQYHKCLAPHPGRRDDVLPFSFLLSLLFLSPSFHLFCPSRWILPSSTQMGGRDDGCCASSLRCRPSLVG
ncbi:hypothetical protein B0H19DRAFT_174338 [Mycena capillaripes]|nr:hypothetical protein B0H19DRAFT_174338 [Mycena capillaripes]